DPNSLAEKAGIQPQDCVQFACVVGGPQFDDDLQRSSSNSNNTPSRNSKRNKSRERQNNIQTLDAKATKFVLECEKRGMRISYEELRDLFAGCTLPPKGGGDGDDHALNKEKLDALHVTPPRNAQQQQQQNNVDDDFTIGSNSLLLADSVGGMFESRSKKYHHSQTISSRRVPTLGDKKLAKNVTLNVTNAARNAAGRCFEGGGGSDAGGGSTINGNGLDDNGSEFAEGNNNSHRTKRRSSAPVLDTPLSPIKSDNIISASSPHHHHHLSPGGVSGITSSSYAGSSTNANNSIVEQSLYPVVMVFRRTVQRKRIILSSGPSKGWGSPGLSLKGSLFGIPSFRMDDECDRAAALIRQLAPSKKRSGSSTNANTTGGGGGKIDASDVFFDDGDSTTLAPTSHHHRDRDRGGGGSVEGEDIEASTIRSCIQHAVGLGFVRLSKVVVGVSLQGGSGIIISRLPDGTWSAPSAMGVYGLGVGLQFGLEVADFMFIIQTNEGMEHFKRGGNFVVGGNIGAAVVNCGREAYGAASLGACTGPLPLDDQLTQEDTMDNERDDLASTFDESTYMSNASTTMRSVVKQQTKKKENDVAPMVAYAKSQGLYFGVSVDGLKFFTRNDINARTYKFSMLSEMPATDILSGLVAPPPEAEDLYSALHSVEYTHDMTELPRPPEMLCRDSMNDWRFDRSIAAVKGDIKIVDLGSDRKSGTNNNFPLYTFLSTLNNEESDQFALFETKFKKFLYGGVAVQHLMPHIAPTRSGMTRREKRTLWLMLPEIGSLRLGFVSKMKDNGGDASTMDDMSLTSSVASSRADADDHAVKLSTKYSVSLTDITTLSQDPNFLVTKQRSQTWYLTHKYIMLRMQVTIRLSPDDATEHLRVLSIHDVTGKSMLFLANSNREAELLFCGLKLLLECETARLSVRGGVPLNKLGGKLGKGALSPLTARGSLKSRSNRRDRSEGGKRNVSRRVKDDLDDRSKYSSFGEPGTSSDESNDDGDKDNEESQFAKLSDRHKVPEGRQSWSQLPGRSAMRQMASGNASPRAQAQAPPTYELGKAICTDIATNISLPLSLALCRVLFLDSSSPVNKAWETGRADSDYRHGAWAFAPGSPREFERGSSEQQLISRGSLAGAQRTISYSRMRNRELVRLSETIFVEKDDDQTLVFVVADQMPRRGFSAKARLSLRSFGTQSCEARVVTEIRPVGKNLSDQLAVHKAFILVRDEMKKRYGVEAKGKGMGVDHFSYVHNAVCLIFFNAHVMIIGLLAVFLDVYNSLPGDGGSSPRRSQVSAVSPGNKSQSSITSFKDVLPGNKVENQTAPRPSPGNRSPSSRNNAALNQLPSPNQLSPRRQQQIEKQRPSTPSVRKIDSKTVGMPTMPTNSPPPQPMINPTTDDFADFSNFDDIPRNPVTVEVKPLPKMRLDLCPVPREEDEEEDSSVSVADAKQKRKSKHSKSKISQVERGKSKHTKHRRSGKKR
ncbi:LOW QUALITY PROTEIN: hypothetical protein ACHAXR_012821, partial [Thalassiosira sp. AJA248-18]